MIRSNAQAIAIAAAMTAEDEDGWTYTVEANGPGWVVIAFDENGYRLGMVRQ